MNFGISPYGVESQVHYEIRFLSSFPDQILSSIARFRAPS